MLGCPGGTDCDGVRFLVHGGWDSRDVSMADVCDMSKGARVL